jgi:hypothetical protein
LSLAPSCQRRVIPMAEKCSCAFTAHTSNALENMLKMELVRVS